MPIRRRTQRASENRLALEQLEVRLPLSAAGLHHHGRDFDRPPDRSFEHRAPPMQRHDGITHQRHHQHERSAPRAPRSAAASIPVRPPAIPPVQNNPEGEATPFSPNLNLDLNLSVGVPPAPEPAAIVPRPLNSVPPPIQPPTAIVPDVGPLRTPIAPLPAQQPQPIAAIDIGSRQLAETTPLVNLDARLLLEGNSFDNDVRPGREWSQLATSWTEWEQTGTVASEHEGEKTDKELGDDEPEVPPTDGELIDIADSATSTEADTEDEDETENWFTQQDAEAERAAHDAFWSTLHHIEFIRPTDFDPQEVSADHSDEASATEFGGMIVLVDDAPAVRPPIAAEQFEVPPMGSELRMMQVIEVAEGEEPAVARQEPQDGGDQSAVSESRRSAEQSAT